MHFEGSVVQRCDILFDVSLNKLLSKHSRGRWVGMAWRSFDVTVMINSTESEQWFIKDMGWILLTNLESILVAVCDESEMHGIHRCDRPNGRTMGQSHSKPRQRFRGESNVSWGKRKRDPTRAWRIDVIHFARAWYRCPVPLAHMKFRCGDVSWRKCY